MPAMPVEIQDSTKTEKIMTGRHPHAEALGRWAPALAPSDALLPNDARDSSEDFPTQGATLKAPALCAWRHWCAEVVDLGELDAPDERLLRGAAL